MFSNWLVFGDTISSLQTYDPLGHWYTFKFTTLLWFIHSWNYITLIFNVDLHILNEPKNIGMHSTAMQIKQLYISKTTLKEKVLREEKYEILFSNWLFFGDTISSLQKQPLSKQNFIFLIFINFSSLRIFSFELFLITIALFVW